VNSSSFSFIIIAHAHPHSSASLKNEGERKGTSIQNHISKKIQFLTCKLYFLGFSFVGRGEEFFHLNCGEE
jgi:hypothetical protein